MISDAEFLRYLQGESRIRGSMGTLVVLAEIEFAYESGGSLATGTIYLADKPYRTRPNDNPASTQYRDAIRDCSGGARSIDLEKLGGRGTMSPGPLTLDNLDGSQDDLLDVIIDGREVRFYIGDQSWSRADFRLVNVAVVASVSGGRSPTIALRAKTYLLDDSLIGDPIASGAAAGKPKPIAMGLVRNFDITPFVKDEANLIYHINNTKIGSIFDAAGDVFAVRDSGGSLRDSALFTFTSATMTASAGTDTLTRSTPHGFNLHDVLIFRNTAAGSLFAGLSGSTQYWVIAAGFTVTDFRLSLTKGGAAVDITGAVMSGTWEVDRRRYYVDAANGALQLSSTPNGRVTLDHTAIPDLSATESPYGFDDSPHGIFFHLVRYYTKLNEGASGLDSPHIDRTAIEALMVEEQVAGRKYGRVITDRTNVLDILDDIATATQSWYASTSAGVLTVGKLDLANLDGETPIDTIVYDDIFGDLSSENLTLLQGKISLDLDPNVTVQGDGLVASVSAADRARWATKYQTRVTTTDPGTSGYLANWWDYHKSAIDSSPIESSIATQASFNSSATDAADAQAVVDEMTALFRPWTRVHRCTVGLDKYALNPGDCIELTFPRDDLDEGKNCRVISVAPNFTDRTVDLVLVRQAIPDYTSASH